MKIRQLLCKIIVGTIALGLFPELSALATIVEEPFYGDEYLTDYGFEEATVGSYQDENWRVYHSLNVAYAEFVSAEEYPDYVIDDIAYRFCLTKGGSGQHGLYYRKELLTDVEYEFSGMFTTDSDNGANVDIFYQDQVSHLEFLSRERLTKGEWKNIKFRICIPKDSYAKTIRMATSLKSSCAYDGSSYNNLKDSIIASGQSFIYVDNVSLKPVSDFWVDNGNIELTDDGADALARVSYDYFYTEGKEEVSSEIEYQTNVANANDGWTQYKTIKEVTSEDALSSSIVTLEPICSGKYLRAAIKSTNREGKTAPIFYTEPVFIGNTSNIISNPNFKWDAIGWTGGEYDADAETLNISDVAEYKCNYQFDAKTSVTGKIDLSGTGQISVYINDKKFCEEELDGEAKQIQFNAEFEPCSEVKIRIIADNAAIKCFTLEPNTPSVYGLAIKGKPIAGTTLEAVYTYDNTNDNGIDEGDTLIEWFVDGTKAGEGDSFTTEQGTNGTVRMSVTPMNIYGVKGYAKSTEMSFYTLYVDNMDIKASSYKTNGILTPSYKYHGDLAEGESRLEWVQSDSTTTPIDEWEVINVPNSMAGRRGIPKATVNSANVSENGWMPLSQESREKYVAFRITPIDANGREGVMTISEPTPIIEFERNLATNGDFSAYNKTTNWRYSVGGYRSENSTLQELDDKTGSIFINGESVNSAFDEQKDETVANGGSDIVAMHPSFKAREGVKYLLSLDAKLDYNHETQMGVNFLYVTSAGYACKQTICNSTDWTRMDLSFGGKKGSDLWSYISVRGGGNPNDSKILHAGKILLDNLEIYEMIPYAENVKIEGEAKLGETLNGSYIFGNVIDAKEYDSKIDWLVSDYSWGPWEEYKKVEGTATQNCDLTIGSDLVGKYIKLRVTPQDTFGTQGINAFSTEELFVAPIDGITQNIETDGDGRYSATASFKNEQKTDRKITAILVGYSENSSAEVMNEVKCESKQIMSGKKADFSLTLDSTDNETARLFFVEGDRFSEWRPIEGTDCSSECSNAVNRAILDQDNKSISVYVTSENAYTPCLVFALKPSVQENNVSAENLSSVLSYIGMGNTGENKSVKYSFIPNDYEDSKAIYIGVNYNSNLKHRYSVIYDNAGTEAIVNAIKTGSKDEIERYILGEPVDGEYSVSDILCIDTKYFELLENKDIVVSALYNRNFTNSTQEIRTIIESLSKECYKNEVWQSKMTGFIDELETVEASGLKELLTKYNDVLNVNLSNQYGFAIELGETVQNQFYTEIIASLKKLVKPTNEETQQEINKHFSEIIALAVLNNGPWDKMDKILMENWSIIGLGKYEKYDNSQYDKTPMYKNIYNHRFSSLNEAKQFIEGQISELSLKTPPKTNNNGGGGGGSSSATGSAPVGIINTADARVSTEWSFSDVKKDFWAYDAIINCAEKGIMRGYSDGTFGTDKLVTRAEFVTTLLRCAGISVENAEAVDFDDVSSNDWFAKEIYTAYGLGIINGISDRLIAPNFPITREEMCAMVYRLYKKELSKTASTNFVDKDDISDYAKTPVEALVYAGIINGTGDDMFEPKTFLTRAMTAQIAIRLIDFVQ